MNIQWLYVYIVLIIQAKGHRWVEGHFMGWNQVCLVPSNKVTERTISHSPFDRRCFEFLPFFKIRQLKKTTGVFDGVWTHDWPITNKMCYPLSHAPSYDRMHVQVIINLFNNAFCMKNRECNIEISQNKILSKSWLICAKLFETLWVIALNYTIYNVHEILEFNKN